MRDEVDEVWRAWGIRATADDVLSAVIAHLEDRRSRMELDFGPLAVYTYGGSHAHHLASLGLWWLALLVAEEPNVSGVSLAAHPGLGSPVMVAVRARRPAGHGADGEVRWAYALGDKEVARMVRAAVAMGEDVNQLPQRAWPLLTYCTGSGCLEAVKACLAAGAEVDRAGRGNFDDMPDGWRTAVVHAAYGGHEAVVGALLEAGASARVGRDGEDETLAAVCQGHPTPGIVRRLAEAGADVNASGPNGTALSNAASRGDLALMEVLLEVGADVVVTNVLGRTAMHHAASAEVVRWLAARGASVQGVANTDSPLLSACNAGRVDAVRALIELGADVHDRNGDGETPLHRASHAACVDLLLCAGADLEARDARGCTPICTVSRYDKAEVILRMADLGADLVHTGGEPGFVTRRVEKLRDRRSRGQLG